MASFTTSNEIVGIVFGLLSTITKPRYRHSKPTGKPGSAEIPEYVVVNSLPVDADVMQKCYVNVNYHVKDIAAGVPDETKILAGNTAVLAILKKYTDPGKTFMLDIESQEMIPDAALGEHYSNMRFLFKKINS
jgi:hypothetical protein